jgi:aspartyl-tRNA synthetase
MPTPETLDLLDTDPTKVIAQAYDLTLNGWELASGSIRVHRSDIQQKIFSVLGLDEAEAEEKFSFFLRALKMGAPPHGGIAPGLDRIVMLLARETNIREVIAFPRQQSTFDPLTSSSRSSSTNCTSRRSCRPCPSRRRAPPRLRAPDHESGRRPAGSTPLCLAAM